MVQGRGGFQLGRRRRRSRWLAGVAGVVAVAAVWGSVPATAAAGASGTARVAYAGSLQYLNEHTIGPAFTTATGDAYQGQGAGSLALSQEIRAGEISPNVFESVGAAPITALQPKFTSWYVSVASSPIVVAYNPKTSRGAELAAIAKGKKPLSDLFKLMSRDSLLIGRTDPNTDPQGQAFYEMVELAQSYLHLPKGTAGKVLGSLDNPSQVFAETELEARLQAGQLDVASAYLSQAIQLHLPYIALPSAINFGSPSLASRYAKARITLSNGTTAHGVPLIVDVTTIGQTDAGAAQAFVAYLLSPAGRRSFKAGGYHLVSPKAYGTDVPATVRRAMAQA
ncbi:MAG: substrate-binding domain-containing protein [Acidimicrobiales bacterium]|nr:substrate-binding domain-containing protein [Acidimicrobiales bacterium]MBO0893144.1 substrate-binding domain-containing protein [Acidimicrobiales bacterium]